MLKAALLVHEKTDVAIAPGIDAQGEDARLTYPKGEACVVQIVSVPPDSAYGREIAIGFAQRKLTAEDAADWIQVSIDHKLTIAPDDRKSILLALDARAHGLLADVSVIVALRARYPDPVTLGFFAIWLVGPIDSRCVRIA